MPTYPAVGGFTVATSGGVGGSGDVAVFIPELWSDEIIASYKSNLVLPQLVVTMNHQGKKGDTIHIPRPARGSASAKAETVAVTIIANNEPEKVVYIDQHWEYSRLIEDFAATQAIDTYRQFYTDDAGYALAKEVDDALHAVSEKLNGAGFYTGGANGDATDPTIADGGALTGAYAGAGVGDATQWDGSANANAGNAAALSDAGIRRYIQYLDDNDVPSMRRVLVIPPVEKRKLNGTADFVRYDAVGEAGSQNTLRNGLVGDLYGTSVYVSTNCANVAADDASTDQKAALMFQREAIVYLEQAAPRSQEQYKQEYLSTLFTSDIIFGRDVLRSEGGVPIIVPAA